MSEDSPEVTDLCFMCSYVYLAGNRDKEAVEAIKELVALCPCFDKYKQTLFQSIYKLVIDSLRNTLLLVTSYYEIETNVDRANFLLQKKESLVADLLPVCKEAIGLIDETLLPNAIDTQAVVFFNKLKGDFYRYVAEYSDETESDAAKQSGEECYNMAFKAAEALPRCDPVRLSLVLNASVFRYEICKEATTALEMLKSTVAEMRTEGALASLSDDEKRETIAMIDYMKQNINMWDEEVNEE